MDDIQKKTVLITGAGQGIGRHFAQRLTKEGHRVAVIDRRADAAHAVAAEIQAAGGEAIALGTDITEAGWGRIINIASAVVPMGRANYLHYVASKAGVVGMTRAMARELGGFGITVNAILPGAVETEVERETVTPEQRAAFIAQRSLPRAQVPEDLGGVVSFLISENAGFMTGQSLIVDGGMIFN